jgi:hypothetical protein
MAVAAERRRAPAEDVAPPVSRQQDPRSLAFAVRIARLLLQPSEFVDDFYLRLGPLEAPQLKQLATHPGFRTPVNRALAAALGLDATDFDRDTIARWSSAPRSRLAVLFTAEPIDDVGRVALSIAAAVLSKRVLRLVLKSDRQVVRETLGEEDFQVATREAPLLHFALAELDLGAADLELLLRTGELAERRRRLVAFGFGVVGRFLDATEPVLADLFANRIHPDLGYGSRDRSIGRLGDTHCEQVLRFVRRRHRSWADIIG